METGKSLIVTKVLPHFFLTLLISFVGVFLGSTFIPTSIALAIGFIPLVALIFLLIKGLFNGGRKKNSHVISGYGMIFPMWIVHAFTFMMGIGISPVIVLSIGAVGLSMVLAAFLITASLFGGLFLYTYFTNRDFSFLGGMLFFALIALILLGIANIFIGAAFLELGLAFLGILVFSGYMLYDISRMKDKSFTERDVPAAVFDLYLNFINIFLDILRIIIFFSRD